MFSKEPTMPVAKKILDQLGGNRFASMTGARRFVSSRDALSFSLPARAALQNINLVHIRLTPADTYVMRFMRLGGFLARDVAVRDDVYADALCSTFSEVTGLAVRL
jgi:hypothetical protein